MRVREPSLNQYALLAVGLLLACSLALGASLLGNSLGQVRSSANSLTQLESFRLVLEAANRISAERGPTNSALGHDTAAMAQAHERMLSFRRASDEAIARLPPSLSPAVDTLRLSLAEARATVDAVLAQPLAVRSSDAVARAVLAMFAAYDTTQPLTDLAMSELLAGDSALIGRVLIARMLGELRDDAGRLGSHLVIAIARGGPMTAPNRIAFEQKRGRVLTLWQLIGPQTARYGAPALAAAYRATQQDFVGAGLQLIEETRQQLESGTYEGTPEAFTDAIVPSFVPIERLRDRFVDDVTGELTTAHRHAQSNLLFVALGIALVLAVELLLLFICQRFLLDPLLIARARIVDLANGRLDQPAQPPRVRGEMRDLFQALGTLRQRLIEREQLDAERARLAARLKRQADTDGLTGVLNRGALERLVQKLVRRPHGPDQVGLVLVDIDHFKAINDRFGHAAGDQALRSVAQRLQQGLRGSDVIARFGGEEFAILVLDGNAGDLALLTEIAERLRHLIEARPVPLDTETEIAITASLGVATAQATPGMWEPLLKAADAALYRAKREGRNRVGIDAAGVEAIGR
ncbi:GGDEF domain-containing protein [Bosea sp. F3-2]|uniref:GGDEF domain-containing protein n=1 Tax=Bosea sp. F3-2 TaxID=2599640 RepID=UPI0011EC0B31|nr:GGDEF domain-containing protein [Bosea sp. F3-2]QEL23216.1 GGDEF domain-containing protein [Bosea sp. F3-2]